MQKNGGDAQHHFFAIREIPVGMVKMSPPPPTRAKVKISTTDVRDIGTGEDLIEGRLFWATNPPTDGPLDFRPYDGWCWESPL